MTTIAHAGTPVQFLMKVQVANITEMFGADLRRPTMVEVNVHV